MSERRHGKARHEPMANYQRDRNFRQPLPTKLEHNWIALGLYYQGKPRFRKEESDAKR